MWKTLPPMPALGVHNQPLMFIGEWTAVGGLSLVGGVVRVLKERLWLITESIIPGVVHPHHFLPVELSFPWGLNWSRPCDGLVWALFCLTVTNERIFRFKATRNALSGSYSTAPVSFSVSRASLINGMSFPRYQCRLIICAI